MSINHHHRSSHNNYHNNYYLGDKFQPKIWDKLHIDPWLLLFLLIICIAGLAILYSASSQNIAMVLRQAVSYLIAFIVMIGMAQIPPLYYRTLTPVFYVLGVILLIAVQVVGEVRMGARRWIGIPGFGSVQPSEFMKLGMPMMCAWFLSRRELPPKFKTVVILLLIILFPTLLVAIQPDLGTSLLVASSGIFVLFLAGLSWRLISLAIFLALLFVPIAWNFLLHDYQRQRINTLLDPDADTLGAGWNTLQAKISIGSGGISGKGYLFGSQSQLGFLPESHTDFIVASFSEEFGFIGILSLVFLYLCLLMRSLYIALSNPDNYGRFLAGAISLSFFVYIFVNMGMVSGILPIVGVPLPLVSYGGTAIITLMAGFGLLMSIHTHKDKK